jgi:hypothetical protein
MSRESTAPLLLSVLPNAELVEVARYDSNTPQTCTVIAVLSNGAVVDVSYGYPISFNRCVECALTIHSPFQKRELS